MGFFFFLFIKIHDSYILIVGCNLNCYKCLQPHKSLKYFLPALDGGFVIASNPEHARLLIMSIKDRKRGVRRRQEEHQPYLAR